MVRANIARLDADAERLFGGRGAGFGGAHDRALCGSGDGISVITVFLCGRRVGGARGVFVHA